MAVQNQEVFLAPRNPNVPIWRYMDFTKFVSMLSRKGLYFSRLDKFNDPFEGSLPKLNITALEQFVPPEIQKDQLPQYRNMIKEVRSFYHWLRNWTFASTWHMAEHESAAMWKLYARTEEAVCIRSTYAKLQKHLPDDVFLGCVTYIDYAQQMIPAHNAFWPLVHKRKSFEHERELRALICDLNKALIGMRNGQMPDSDGQWRDCDLASLVDAIYVAPTAPVWFKETLEATIRQFGFSFPVIRSALDETPIW